MLLAAVVVQLWRHVEERGTEMEKNQKNQNRNPNPKPERKMGKREKNNRKRRTRGSVSPSAKEHVLSASGLGFQGVWLMGLLRALRACTTQLAFLQQQHHRPRISEANLATSDEEDISSGHPNEKTRE